MRSGTLLVFGVACAGWLAAQGQSQPPAANDTGRKSFELRCGRCHGGDGKGGEMGPDISGRVVTYRTDVQLTSLIHAGIPASGMPATKLEGPELLALVRFVRSIGVRPAGGGRGAMQLPRITVETAGGKLEGVKLGEGFDDLQMRTDDGKIHLLRKAGGKYREVTSEVDWPEYNGDPRGNRYTTMAQIGRDNVSRLAPRWMFAFPPVFSGRGTPPMPPDHLQMTPVVVGGLMYITNVNECIALDAGSGRQVWRFNRPRTPAVMDRAGANRG
ncbi:MAG TPA: c-type cytochrome, partial [Rhizomicrobium sp.]|nr:c-type cytochrome [Rhizomicrobium sp.]